jgi:hypothetical protein
MRSAAACEHHLGHDDLPDGVHKPAYLRQPETGGARILSTCKSAFPLYGRVV